MQSLANKVDELRTRISFQRDIRDCNIFSFTETWLSRDILSLHPSGFSVHCADRNKELSGKKKGGECFMINYSWCDCDNIQKLKSFCSPNLEYLTIKCQPYYLPREFSLVIVTAMYIPPQADTTTALKELHWTSCKPHILRPHLL